MFCTIRLSFPFVFYQFRSIFIEIDYIREFVVLAKQGNYLVASEELFISQSSLSKHIIALERELGYPLFNRTTRKVELNQHGRLFLPHAQNIVDTEAAFRSKVAAMTAMDKDSFQLGVLPSFLSYHLDQIIMDFKHRYPQYSVSLTEDTSDMLLLHLKEGTCNLAIVRTYEDSLPPDYISIPIFYDRLALLITPGSPLDDGRTSVTWKDLEHVELLSGSLNSKKLASLIEKLDIRLNIVSRMSRASSTIDMLRKGGYTAALMNKLIAAFYLEKGPYKIIDIQPPINNTVSLVYRKDTPQTAVMRHFIETVRSHATEPDRPEK